MVDVTFGPSRIGEERMHLASSLPRVLGLSHTHTHESRDMQPNNTNTSRQHYLSVSLPTCNRIFWGGSRRRDAFSSFGIFVSSTIHDALRDKVGSWLESLFNGREMEHPGGLFFYF